MARKFGCTVTGITLSPVQAEHATARSQAAGLAELTNFQVADALAMPFPDASFDLIWSIEVGEAHI
jgi:tocopherol O-methyltransferase